MPWCEDCSKFWTPPSMNEDGSCPTCGRVLVAQSALSEEAASSDVSSDRGDIAPIPSKPRYNARTIDVKELAGEEGKAPWHFKLLVVAIVLYLGWRVVQLVAWLIP